LQCAMQFVRIVERDTEQHRLYAQRLYLRH
jgi:hypothetical protein